MIHAVLVNGNFITYTCELDLERCVETQIHPVIAKVCPHLQLPSEVLPANSYHRCWYRCQSAVNEYLSLIIADCQNWCIILHCHGIGVDY